MKEKLIKKQQQQQQTTVKMKRHLKYSVYSDVSITVYTHTCITQYVCVCAYVFMGKFTS